MIKYLMSLVLALVMLYGFSEMSFAQGKSAGHTTVLLDCIIGQNIDCNDGGGPFQCYEVSVIDAAGPGGACGIGPRSNLQTFCEDGRPTSRSADPCVTCLNFLLGAGMNIVNGPQCSREDEGIIPASRLCHWTLTGPNAPAVCE